MLSLRAVAIAACFVSCIEAHQPRPDEVDDAPTPDAHLDMQTDAVPDDRGPPDQRIADAAPVDMSADMSAPRCDAFSFHGSVYDCTVDLCHPIYFHDRDYRLACCHCDPEFCSACDHIAG